MTAINHTELFKKPGISPTSINDYLNGSASKFWRRSSYNPNRIKKDATPAMLFGRLVHALVLTPDAVDSEFVVYPSKTEDHLDTIDDLKKFINEHKPAEQSIPAKINKAELQQIVRTNWPQALIWDDVMTRFKVTMGDRSIISKEQFEQAKSMQDQMSMNRAVKNLIGNGFSEQPFCWYPEGEDGLMKKCRMDYNRQGLVIEYKTTIDPSGEQFAKDIGNMGYHRQLAWQFDASTRMLGEPPKGALIIAQDKEAHDDIAIYAVDPMSLGIGAAENDAAFEAIKERMATMNWKSYPEEIRPISLPRWYQQKAA